MNNGRVLPVASVLLFASATVLIVLVASGRGHLTSGAGSGASDPGYHFVLQWGEPGSGDGQFRSPVDSFVHSSGDVYVADYENHRIQRFDASGGFVGKWGSFGSGPGELNKPEKIAQDSSGNVYVADTDNCRIQAFTPSGDYVLSWSVPCFPRGLALDSQDNVYVPIWGANKIMKFAWNGEAITEWGGVDLPEDVAVGPGDSIYVIHRGGVSKFDPAGDLQLAWGGVGSDPGLFDFAQSITADGLGNVYVADTANNRIQKFDATGNLLLVLGLYGHDPGEFAQPNGLGVDSAGNLFVADSGNNRIQKFGPGAAQPAWQLPWEDPEATSWQIGTRDGGFHLAWDPGSAQNGAVDFIPPGYTGEDCSVPANIWIHPVARGLVVDTGRNYIEIDHGTGTRSVYYHVANIPSDQVAIGKTVYASTRLGNPSCEAGRGDGGFRPRPSHLHFAIKRQVQGIYQFVDLPDAAIDMCGWKPQAQNGVEGLWRDGVARVASQSVSCGPLGSPVYQQTTLLAQGETQDLSIGLTPGQILLGAFFGWSASTVDSWLTAPDGTVIDPSTTDPNVFHTKGEAFEYYEIRSPQAGDWTLHLYGAELPPEGEPIDVVVTSCVQPPGDAAGDPCVADDDGDGLTDQEELSTYLTDPLNPDTDSDGSADGEEVTQGTNPLNPDTDADTVLDGADNCPLTPNPGQENTDAAIDNGPGIAGDDATIPNAVADSEGDACETDGDIDNDGLPDSEDINPLGGSGICAAFAGASDSHPKPAGGDVTNDDNHNGDPAPPMGADAADNGPSWDTDGDGALDGVECTLNHNPRSRAERPSTAECGGTGDTDGDGLLNAWETCGWGTSPTVVDSDGDGKGDCKEAADVDGNGLVNFVGDTMDYAQAALLPPGDFCKTMDFDIDKNGLVDFVGDVMLEAQFALIDGLCK